MVGAAVIQTRGLTKRYGGLTAVNGLDLTVAAGEVLALLGPNGAGKTTTLLMLLGLTRPSGGTAEVFGLPAAGHSLEIKSRVGYLPENVGFYGDMTARQNLSYMGELKGLKGPALATAAAEVLELVGLAGTDDRRVAAFSRGMRQRLGLAEALLGWPELLFLDEPTLGLDPDGIDQVLGLITALSAGRGLTVVISSHLLPLVEKVAGRVLILKQGRPAALGRPAELAAAAGLPGGDLSAVYRHYLHAGDTDL